MIDDLGTDLAPVVAEQPDPLLFATVCGAHLHGFPAQDSDVDLRGAHLLPAADLLGLREPAETRSRTWVRQGVELDLATHDLRKFARLMLRRNGHVLEQLVSPLVVHTSEAHRELVALVPGVLTSRHAHHYRGLAVTQWRLFEKTGEPRPLLRAFRVLLTGIHLMRTGEVQPHLPTLAEQAGAPGYVPELIAAVQEGAHGAAGVDRARAEADLERLHTALDEAQAGSALPAAAGARDALHDLVVRLRLRG